MYCCQSVREDMLERFGIMYTIYDNTYDMNNNDFIYKQQSDGGQGKGKYIYVYNTGLNIKFV